MIIGFVSFRRGTNIELEPTRKSSSFIVCPPGKRTSKFAKIFCHAAAGMERKSPWADLHIPMAPTSFDKKPTKTWSNSDGFPRFNGILCLGQACDERKLRWICLTLPDAFKSKTVTCIPSVLKQVTKHVHQTHTSIPRTLRVLYLCPIF